MFEVPKLPDQLDLEDCLKAFSETEVNRELPTPVFLAKDYTNYILGVNIFSDFGRGQSVVLPLVQETPVCVQNTQCLEVSRLSHSLLEKVQRIRK